MKEHGFTLIEIIVVFSVIAILSLIGVASFVSYSRIQAVQTATLDLSNFLFLAKSRAISQVKPSKCPDNQILNGYDVFLNRPSVNSYELDVRCSGFDYPIQSASLPKNVTFGVGTSSFSFFFPIIVSGVEGPGTIIISGYGNTKTITVDLVGGITIQ